MKVSDLYGTEGPVHGKDVYVIGLGPSMAVMPPGFLERQCCILLNDAQKWFPTLGPVAVANHKDFLKPLSAPIRYPIVKGRLRTPEDPAKADDNHVPWDHPQVYVFSYRLPQYDGGVDSNDRRTLWQEPCHYWIGGTSAGYAVQFALQGGCRSILLVGCDCGPLAGQHYASQEIMATKKPTSRAIAKAVARRKNEPPNFHSRVFSRDYPYYSESLLLLKREAEEKFHVPIMTLLPFVGLDGYAQQLTEIKGWTNASQ